MPYVLDYNSNGLPNLKNHITGNSVHSRRDPHQEGSRFAEEIVKNYLSQSYKVDQLVCFGFGMGYHVESILELSGGNIQLTCIEPDPTVLEIPEVKKKS